MTHILLATFLFSVTIMLNILFGKELYIPPGRVGVYWGLSVVLQ